MTLTANERLSLKFPIWQLIEVKSTNEQQVRRFGQLQRMWNWKFWNINKSHVQCEKPFWYDIWWALLIEQKSWDRRNSSLSLFVASLKKLPAPHGFLAFLWLQTMLKTWHFHTRTQFHLVWSLTPNFMHMSMYLKALPARPLPTKGILSGPQIAGSLTC